MPDESNDSPKPSWKRKKSAGAPPDASKRASASRREWTKRRETPADDLKLTRGRGFWLAVVGAGFAVSVLGLVALILLIQPPRPAAVVFVSADYAANLAAPQNVAGRRGIEKVRALSKIPRSFAVFNPPWLRPVLDAPVVLDRKDEWKKLIDDLNERNIREQTIVFVVALQGVADAGGAYLLPNLAAGPEDRLPVSEVVASLAGKFPGKNKVLILEGAQTASDWRQGMLQNDFARCLEELEPEIEKADRLWVLSGCDVDQICWKSEGLGSTVFLHFLTEALQGKAAGSDGRIYLDELHQYLARNVRDWVWSARAALQEPVLLPRSRGGGGSGGGPGVRSRSGADRVFLASAIRGADGSPASAAPVEIPNRDQLKRAWRNFHELDAAAPHPAVHAPARWRLYRSVLVRCEELIQSGDGASSAVERLFGLLNGWDNDFAAERPLGLGKSIENSLAANALQGGRIDDPDPPPDLTRFWEPARPEQLKEVWGRIAAAGASALGERSSAPPGLSARSRAYLDLLNRAVRAGDVVNNLNRAAERILIAKGEGPPLPSEAFLLRMLKIHLPLENRPPHVQALVAEALAVRRQAERAALGIAENETTIDFPYCERIHPWIGPLVEAADADRRRGEDLLFATEEYAVRDAREALARARVQYQAAASRAAVVRAAFAARDRAFARLPDYSRWLAHRHPKDVSDQLAATVRALWPRVHRLSELLKTPSATASLDELAVLTNRESGVGAELDRTARKFVEQQREYDADRRPEDWEAATAAAASTFLDDRDLSIREAIWARLDHIRREDVELASKLDSIQPSSSVRDDKAQDLKARGLVEGETALAVLGQGWYDDPRFGVGARGRFAQDADALDKARTDKGQRSSRILAEIGERIGGRIRAVEQALAESLDKEEALSDLKQARERLPRADLLARALDARTPLPPPGESAPRPSWRLRRLLGHDLLNWSARRAWLDHWYDEDPKARPYYQAVGSRFVEDAFQLFPKSPEAAEVQALLDARSGLGFDEPAPILFTSELSRSVGFRLIENGKVPEGTPVARPEPDAALKLEGNDQTGYRIVARRNDEKMKEGDGKEAGRSIAYVLSSPRVRQAESDPASVPHVESAAFKIRGFFRGQVFERTTPVEIDPIPEVAIEGPGLPNPSAASLAVRASQEIVNQFGEGNGSIAIVLDCSGSMVEAGSPKFAEAKESLIAVLKHLPPGTRLSIWIFGQAADGFINGDNARPIDVEQHEKPELTIRVLRPAALWNPADLEPLREALDGLIPFHGTPLLEAVCNAKVDLDKAKGLKTMLVLTDGKDSRFAENRRFNPSNATIPEFVRNYFKDSGITVNMIFFKLNEKEAKEARDQFEDAISSLEPPGHYFAAQDRERLLATLRRSIKQRLTCRIVGSDGKTAGELDVTSPNEEARWWTEGLRPGSYTLKVQADRVYERGVDLERGDRLVIRLISDGGGIGFERALYSDDFPIRRDSDGAGGWRFSAVRARYEDGKPSGALHLFTILEPTTSDAARLRQARPRFAWFELSPQDGGGGVAVRWRELGGYPAPAWRGAAERWPNDSAGAGPAGPALDAWWIADRATDPEVGLLPLEFDGPRNVDGRSVRSDDGAAAIVESIRVESHPLRVRADRDEPEQVDCLVVRIRYPRNKPFLVDPGRLPGIAPSGFEHRFYLRAGAYTGLFGPITRSEIDGLRSLSLVSIARLKSLAEERKQSAALKLPQPRSAERLPEPPQAVIQP